MNVIIRQITLTLVVSLALVCCEPPLSTQYGVPANLPVDSINDEPHNGFTNSYGAPLGSYGRQDVHQDYIDSQPKSYEFGYAVKDSATGNDFGRQETSDGETVRGEYRVQLPDGRTQIVIYTADWKTGFHADVRYEGEATYPEQNNNGYSNNNQNNHNINYIGYNNDNNDNINNNNNHHQHNGYNAVNNNLNSYHAVGYNYNQNNHNEYDGDNQHHHRHHHHHQNNHRNYNDLNNNNYQYSSQNNQYNGFNGNNLDSQSPRTYGAPQYH